MLSRRLVEQGAWPITREIQFFIFRALSFMNGQIMNTQKRFWRCHVCNDIHYGIKPPETCPTCGVKNAFVLCDRSESLNIMSDVHYAIDTSADVIDAWKDFAQKTDFKLWEEEESVRTLSEGVLENMRNKGLKFCPCRITTGDREKDLKLICPCNFKSQQTWKEYGECWCGLFVKKVK